MARRKLQSDTAASNPGRMTVSKRKLKAFHPEFYGFYKILRMLMGKPNEIYEHIIDHMDMGDSQPAVVVSTFPLLVAAYTVDIDCVAMLHFDESLIDQFGLKEKSRLISVNTYGTSVNSDLIPGINRFNSWNCFHPIIADFVSDDENSLREKKMSIEEAQWDYVYALGKDYLLRKPGIYRDGKPGNSRFVLEKLLLKKRGE